MLRNLSDLNVVSFDALARPDELKKQVPLTERGQEAVALGRQSVMNILDRKDPRLMVVVGPCSIHDVKAAKEYAERLSELSKELDDTLVLVMRVYFEKPRTTVGWKGFLNDPFLNDTFKLQDGLLLGRQLLVDLSDLGLALGTEALDPISPQYLQDTISWSAIGARTTESQTHREMASGLSNPIGFKNGTDGGIQVAINAMKSAGRPHRFLGIDQSGHVSVIHTRGNRYGHVVLRGGDGRPNYDSVSVSLCEKKLLASNLPANIMVDCSHANSNKDPGLQPLVLENVMHQIKDGNRSIIGLMIESNLNWGSQELGEDLSALKYGVSVTDACIDWKTTEDSLRMLRNELKSVLPNRKAPGA